MTTIEYLDRLIKNYEEQKELSQFGEVETCFYDKGGIHLYRGIKVLAEDGGFCLLYQEGEPGRLSGLHYFEYKGVEFYQLGDKNDYM